MKQEIIFRKVTTVFNLDIFRIATHPIPSLVRTEPARGRLGYKYGVKQLVDFKVTVNLNKQLMKMK